MKLLQRIMCIASVFLYAISLPASKGRTAVEATYKIGSAAAKVGAAEASNMFLPKYTYAEEYKTPTKSPQKENSNYQPLVAPYQQKSLFTQAQVDLNPKHLTSTTTSPKNVDLQTGMIHGKPITIDMQAAFNSGHEPASSTYESNKAISENQPLSMTQRIFGVSPKPLTLVPSLEPSSKENSVATSSQDLSQSSMQLAEQNPQVELNNGNATQVLTELKSEPIRQEHLEQTNFQSPEITPSTAIQEQFSHQEHASLDIADALHNSPTEITPAQPAATHNNQTMYTEKQNTFQADQQSFDIQQIYIEESSKKITQIIHDWTVHNKETTSNMYVQKNLEDEILNMLFIKDAQGEVQIDNLQSDKAIIEKLLKTFADNKDAQNVLHGIMKTINEHSNSQKVTPQQANAVIARYYIPETRMDVITFMKKGDITAMPSIESIIKAAQENPTQQALQALQAANKAIKIAIYASRNDTSILGDGHLLAQIKVFEKDLAKTLANPNFTKFQSWGSYAMSFLPSTETILDVTGLGNVKVSTAINATKSTINSVRTPAEIALAVSGAGEITLGQIGEKTGIITSDKDLVKEAAKIDQTTSVDNVVKKLTPFQQQIKEINERHAEEEKNLANNAIIQQCTPAMLYDLNRLLTAKPLQSAIAQKPVNVETLIEIALDNPSQESFNALQAVLEATKVAIYAAKINDNNAILTQLKTYEKQLTTTLQTQQFNKFHSWTTQATSYVASFMPVIINATRVKDMTLSSALDTAQSAARLAEQALNYTGVSQMTISQLAQKTGIIAGTQTVL